jgi:lysozyme
MRKINADGLALVKKFEGCRLEAYLCAAKVPTIGWGHTGDVKLGQKITQHQADVILELDLEKFEEGVEKLFPETKLSDNAFSALVSFSFNVGLTALANSTLRKKLLEDDHKGAGAEFGKWVKAGGKVLTGLQKRRAAEAALFLRTQ